MNKLHSITLGIGAAFSLLAFTSASHAGVIVNNLTDTPSTAYNSATDPVGAVFTSDVNGSISALTLQLRNQNGTLQSGTVYLYAVSGGKPTSSLGEIGTFSFTSAAATSTSVSIALSGTQPSLVDGTSYAIIMNGYAASTTWDYTTSSTGNENGLLGGTVWDNKSGTWTAANLGAGNHFLQMDLETVPEVPMTGVFMGFGALAIAVGHTLRRKYLAAKIA